MEFKLLIAGIILFVVARIMRIYKSRISKPVVQKVYNEAYEWIETGWSAVILASFIMYFFLQAFKIPSGSMRMTLLEGDHLFVNKCVYGFRVPMSDGKRFWQAKQVKRGDIVVFKCPQQALSKQERDEKIEKDFIKRCVALGGDIVEVKKKVLFVNGQQVNEPYVHFEDSFVYPPLSVLDAQKYQKGWESGQFAELSPEIIRDNFGPVKVPQGYYMVMGDNRDRSFDARFWGPLPDKYMKGRALLLYWPLTRLRIIR